MVNSNNKELGVCRVAGSLAAPSWSTSSSRIWSSSTPPSPPRPFGTCAPDRVTLYSSCYLLGKPQKSFLFWWPWPLSPYPHPLELTGHKIISGFFFELQRKVFFLSGQAPRPLLVARPLKKNFFLRGPLGFR